jgi:hypothetical protein
MQTCRKCGARLKRVHRTCLQRFSWLAAYHCPECRQEEFVPRFTYRRGDQCCCPRCGNTRLTTLRERDRIDKMESGLSNFFARLRGGQLYHCCFCRLQFYDRRPVLERKERPEHTAESKTFTKFPV